MMEFIKIIKRWDRVEKNIAEYGGWRFVCVCVSVSSSPEQSWHEEVNPSISLMTIFIEFDDEVKRGESDNWMNEKRKKERWISIATHLYQGSFECFQIMIANKEKNI